MKSTQASRLLDVLSDGQWHNSLELYRSGLYGVVHSNVAALRKKGHTIACDQRGVGAANTYYRLEDAFGDVEPTPQPQAEPELEQGTLDIGNTRRELYG